jgi:hypothetical protein
MKTYPVTHGAVSVDGILYQQGDTIVLSDALAKQLAIHLGKPFTAVKPEPASEAGHG